MGNGFTVNGSEIARNSARGGSANLAVKEASEFAQTREVFMGAAYQDGQLMSALGNNAKIIIEEAAREFHIHSGQTGQLPDDWKQRILDSKDTAVHEWLCRPRG